MINESSLRASHKRATPMKRSARRSRPRSAASRPGRGPSSIRLSALAGIGTALAGCGPSEPVAAPPYLAVQRVDELQRWARTEGHIVVEDGCIWLRLTEGIRYLPIWPPGSGLTSAGGIDGVDVRGDLVPLGARVVLGGGTASESVAEALVAEPPPDSCRDDDVWVVSSVAEVAGIPLATD